MVFVCVYMSVEMGLALLIWICSILQKLLRYVGKAEQRCAKEWRLTEVVLAINIHAYEGHNIVVQCM